VSQGEGGVTRGDVAKGAGLAGLARAGSLIEAVAQPIYIWLFGLAGYGLYVVLWGTVNLLSNIVDLSMTSALQRIVPSEASEERVHGFVKGALLIAMVPAVLLAALVTVNADRVAGLFSAAPEDVPRLPAMVALFIWALPAWTFVEVATSAVRARRAFGPEIRLRLFWEQIARVLFALAFFAFGFDSIGLMAAHLCSLTLTALLCVRLLGRFYDLKLLLVAPVGLPLLRGLAGTGAALLPASVSRRLLIDAPPLVLNLMLPGARGAVAAGLFEIARKISTVPLAVRQAFQYVMAPLSAAQAHADRAAIGPLYRFASRVSTALVVPLTGLLIFAGTDILSLYRPEAKAALPLLYILVTARGIEAIVGPATPIVEMTGHRVLPLLNSLIGLFVWAVLALALVPDRGETGMAIAIAAATVATAYAAVIELRRSDGLSPFDRRLFQGLGIALVGVAAMAGAEWLLDGPVRFVAVTALWAITSWCALRFGLVRGDREALGGMARRLRLL
jgi:O-antigen/teichoic acid export membrane protein